MARPEPEKVGESQGITVYIDKDSQWEQWYVRAELEGQSWRRSNFGLRFHVNTAFDYLNETVLSSDMKAIRKEGERLLKSIQEEGRGQLCPEKGWVPDISHGKTPERKKWMMWGKEV